MNSDISYVEIEKQTKGHQYVGNKIRKHSITVLYSKTIVSNESHQKLLTAMNTITVPTNEKKVKKLIDPDLCIGKELVTKERWDGIIKVKETVPKWHWIPSEFVIDSKSKRVKAISHIEHFEPQKDNHVYSAISAVFSDMWPMLERVLSIDTKSKENIVLPVIVKVQSCSMPPLAVYEGFWHQENVTKGIVAVGLYYYEYDSNLSKGQLDVRPAQVIYHAFSEEGKVYKFGEDDGHIPVQEGTAIVFDNTEVVHKFATVTNNHMQMDSYRSFITFFVLGQNSKYENINDHEENENEGWGV